MAHDYIFNDASNVLLIQQKQFDLAPKTLEAVRGIHKCDCNARLPIDVCVGDNCYVALKYETDAYYLLMHDLRQTNDMRTIEMYRDNIQGFLVIEQPKESLAEIWDVCTSQEHRRKGVAKALLDTLRLIVNEQAWLGIDPSNPSWDTALHTYVSAGFQYPILTDRSPSGQQIGFNVVGLIFQRGTILDRSEVRRVEKSANVLRNLALTGVCDESFFFPPELMQKMYRKVHEIAEEESGAIVVREARDDGTYIVGVPVDSLKRGDPGTWWVDISDYPFVFHTHPQVCYLLAQCYIAWPSHMDMEYTTIQAKRLGLKGHVVFTFEGIYAIQVIPSFFDVLEKLDHTSAETLAALVRAKFLYDDIIKGDVAVRQECLDGLLTIECLTANPERKDEYIDRFLRDSRLLTLFTLIRWGLEYPEMTNITQQDIQSLNYYLGTFGQTDTLMFHIDYIKDWDGAMQHGMLTSIKSNYGTCPFPFFTLEEQNKTNWRAVFV